MAKSRGESADVRPWTLALGAGSRGTGLSMATEKRLSPFEAGLMRQPDIRRENAACFRLLPSFEPLSCPLGRDAS